MCTPSPTSTRAVVVAHCFFVSLHKISTQNQLVTFKVTVLKPSFWFWSFRGAVVPLNFQIKSSHQFTSLAVVEMISFCKWYVSPLRWTWHKSLVQKFVLASPCWKCNYWETETNSKRRGVNRVRKHWNRKKMDLNWISRPRTLLTHISWQCGNFSGLWTIIFRSALKLVFHFNVEQLP